MKKPRRIWLIGVFAGLIVAFVIVGISMLTSTPFQFLSGSKLVSYLAAEPPSHSPMTADYFQRIFEIDRAISDVLKDARKELPPSSGWVEESWEGSEEVSFSKGDEFVIVMPHGSDPQATAVLYVRSASRVESWLKSVLYKVPERYDEWQ